MSLLLPLVDAHTHLQNARPCKCERSSLMPVFGAVVCSTAFDFEAVARCEGGSDFGFQHIFPAFGYHPWWAQQVVAKFESVDAAISALGKALRSTRSASVGEIGLDKSPRGLKASHWEAQLQLFLAQLSLAASLRRPVSIHCVRCFDDLLHALTPYGVAGSEGIPAILLHSFSGSPAVTSALLSLFPVAEAGELHQTRLFFSFQGSIVAPVVAEYVRALRGSENQAVLGETALCSSAATETSVEGDSRIGESTRHPLPRGANKRTMSVLSSLRPENLVFETDAPDQGFCADDSRFSSYRHQWIEKVMQEIRGDIAGDCDSAATTVEFATTIGTVCTPESSVGIAVSGASCAADENIARCCAVVSGASCVDDEDEVGKLHCTHRVIDVLLAASTWRCFKRLRSPRVANSKVPLSDHRDAAGPISDSDLLRRAMFEQRWPSVSDTAHEARLLAGVSTQILLGAFRLEKGTT